MCVLGGPAPGDAWVGCVLFALICVIFWTPRKFTPARPPDHTTATSTLPAPRQQVFRELVERWDHRTSTRGVAGQHDDDIVGNDGVGDVGGVSGRHAAVPLYVNTSCRSHQSPRRHRQRYNRHAHHQQHRLGSSSSQRRQHHRASQDVECRLGLRSPRRPSLQSPRRSGAVAARAAAAAVAAATTTATAATSWEKVAAAAAPAGPNRSAGRIVARFFAVPFQTTWPFRGTRRRAGTTSSPTSTSTAEGGSSQR
jgi:hypothetical protein